MRILTLEGGSGTKSSIQASRARFIPLSQPSSDVRIVPLPKGPMRKGICIFASTISGVGSVMK